VTPPDSLPMLFVLGCERSASTWMANVFDSHPEVELLMEPFAPYADLFPGLPGRNDYLGTSGQGYSDQILSGYRKATACKHPLLWRPGKPPGLRRIDELAVKCLEFGSKGLRRSPPLFALRYRLLSLNQADLRREIQLSKPSPPQLRVTKELRLNFKVHLLHRVYPDARYVVTIRDPAAQVASILRLMKNNHLTELRSTLPEFFRLVREAPQLDLYRDLIRDVDIVGPGLPSAQDLLRWWAINYDVLIRDLIALDSEFMIVRHERMSADPLATTADLLDFSRLSHHPQVAEFVRVSSSTSGDPNSPVDTRRQSKPYAQAGVDQADPALRDELAAMAKLCPLTDAVRAYASP
jgi:hypothetical protein